MKIKLVVNEPFSKTFTEGSGADAKTERRSYERGDLITEAAEMKAVRETHGAYVVATAAEPPEGDPDHKPPPAAKATDGAKS